MGSKKTQHKNLIFIVLGRYVIAKSVSAIFRAVRHCKINFLAYICIKPIPDIRKSNCVCLH